MQRLAALLLLAVLAVSLASCGGGSGSSSSSTPTSVTLSPTSMTLNYGDVVKVVPTFVNSSSKPSRAIVALTCSDPGDM
jgi:hypothetical protein